MEFKSFFIGILGIFTLHILIFVFGIQHERHQFFLMFLFAAEFYFNLFDDSLLVTIKLKNVFF